MEHPSRDIEKITGNWFKYRKLSRTIDIKFIF